MDDAQEISGYRVLRRLAVGSRSTVLLAHRPDAADGVVLKVAPADDPAAMREAAALDRGGGDHVVPLLDACADDDRLVLVMPRLTGPDLARLLADRTEFEGGEAVTILAPLAATIARLHAAGVAHGALVAASVLFDAEGAPMLIGFGAAAVFEAGLPEVALERVPEVAADRAALRTLSTAVLGRVGGPRRSAAQRLLGALDAVPDAGSADLLAAELFEVAAARPVRFADPPPALGGAGGRLVPISDPIDTIEPRGISWTARIEALLHRSPAAELKSAVQRRWSGMTPRRRRLVLGAGVGAVALIAALLVIPEGAAPSAVAVTGRPSPSRSGAVQPSAPQSPGPADPSGDSTVGGPVEGDDPVTATTALLRARAGCRRALSVLCLDGVDQDGSAAADADREAIRAAQSGGELPADPLPSDAATAPVLAERLGGSALIALGGGASVLVVKGSGGWRIRDILAAPSSGPTAASAP